MKKTFKRAGVAVLSMAMLISMGAVGAMTASAAVNSTAQDVTIANTYGGNYNIYKVLDATVASGGLTYTYDFATGFSASDSGYTVDQIAAFDSSNAADMKILANALKNDARTASPATPISFTISGSSTSVVPAGTTVSLDPGYYLILTDSTTPDTQMTVAPTLVSVRSDVNVGTITPKTSSLELDKYITGVTQGSAKKVVGSTNGEQKANSAQGVVGNIVSYAIETKTPKYASTVSSLSGSYQIVDTPSSGLDYVANSIVVYVDVNGNGTFEDATEKVYYYDTAAHYIQFNKSGTDTNIVSVSGTTVTFDNAFVLGNQDKAVKVTLDTSINNNAIAVENTNSVTLTYNNDYYEGSSTGTLTDTVKVYSTKVVLTKTFSDNPASGSYPVAGFTLYKDSISDSNIVATASTTASNKELTFNELAAGSYILVETGVPDGYVKADNLTFTISADKNGTEYDGSYTLSSESSGVSLDTNENYVQATAANVKGETLPGTGGIGTTLFTVGGAAIVLLAGAMFVVYMRRRKNEE